MNTKKNIRLRHRVFFKFVVSIASIFLVMIGFIALFTYQILMRASVEVGLILELIVDEILIGFGITGLAILVIVMAVRSIVKPVEAMSRALHRLAEGDYDTVVDYKEENELGQLVQEFDMLRDALHKQYTEEQISNSVSNIKLLEAGTKVDIYIDSEKPLKTLVKNVLEDGNIVIFPPFHQGRAKDLAKGQKLKIFFYPAGNRYSAIVEVEDIGIVDGEFLVMLTPLSEPISVQRRKAYRMNVECEAFARRYDCGPFPSEHDVGHDDAAFMKTIDISAEGALVDVNEDYDEGEKLFFRLHLPLPEQEPETVDLTAEIVRKDRDSSGRVNKIGVRFIDTAPNTHSTLVKFILSLSARQKVSVPASPA